MPYYRRSLLYMHIMYTDAAYILDIHNILVSSHDIIPLLQMNNLFVNDMYIIIIINIIIIITIIISSSIIIMYCVCF